MIDELLSEIRNLHRRIEALERLEHGGGTSYTDELARDAVGAMVTGNTETGIAVTYDDGTDKLNFVVDAEFIADTVGAMLTGNTETGITATYDDSDNTIDLVADVTLSNAVLLTGDQTVAGDKTFSGILKADSVFRLSPGGTQDYDLSDDTADALTLQSQGAGKSFDWRMFTKDGDATDSIQLSLWGKGTPSQVTDRERMRFIWNAASGSYEIDSEANGTGTLRPINIFTEGNANQLNIAANGRIGFKVAVPLGALHIHNSVGGFLFVTKTGIAGSAVEIIPDGTGDVTIGVRIQGVSYNSASGFRGFDLSVGNGGSDFIDPAGDGVNKLTFTCNANGQLTVARTAGSATWQFAAHLDWL